MQTFLLIASKKRVLTKSILLRVAVFTFFLTVFYVITPISHLDFFTHNQQLIGFYQTGYWRPNFAYYLLVALLSGFSKDIWLLSKVATIVMAVAVYAKWQLTDYLSRFLFEKNSGKVNFKQLSLAMLFVFSLPFAYNNWYFGQISPNQWHNSTTILLMPFAIFLFYHSYLFFLESNPKSYWTVMWLSIINVLIKPSFLFCLFPVIGFLVVYNIPSKAWLKKIIVLLPALVILAAQYIVLYLSSFKSATALSGEDGGVAFSFLHVWSYYSDNILLSFLLSVAFPFTVFLFYGKQLLKEKLYWFTLTLFGVGVLIFVCLTETGSRQFHCNFIWQAIITNYFLYWVTLIWFLKHTIPKSKTTSITILSILNHYINNKQYKDLVVFGLFLLQCLGGLYYLMRMVFREGSYA